MAIGVSDGCSSAGEEGSGEEGSGEEGTAEEDDGNAPQGMSSFALSLLSLVGTDRARVARDKTETRFVNFIVVESIGFRLRYTLNKYHDSECRGFGRSL